MAVLVVLGLLFVVVAVAGIAGWGVDSRNSRYSLWPLYRAVPNEFCRRDAKRPDAPRSPAPLRRGTRGSETLPERRDAVRSCGPHSARGQRPARVAQCLPATDRAVVPSNPAARPRRAERR
jgi:hypothetical protein